jgi:FKBP-type peptidyl-prolyl cis-trans isomerase 2
MVRCPFVFDAGQETPDGLKGEIMGQAKNGDTVKVHYTGKLDDGTVFDSSVDREPLEFKIGEGRLIPGFEQAVIGMSSGESKSTTIPHKEAYGRRQEQMVQTIDRNLVPADLELKVGQLLRMTRPDGQAAMAKVKDFSDSNVTLDLNHPLAGKDLTFDIDLVEIT